MISALEIKPRSKTPGGYLLCDNRCGRSGRMRVSILGYPLERRSQFCVRCAKEMRSTWDSALIGIAAYMADK